MCVRESGSDLTSKQASEQENEWRRKKSLRQPAHYRDIAQER